MTKFTSILLLATAALASFSAAAPIAATSTAAGTDEPLITGADASIFASSNKYKGRATWFTDSYGSCNVNWDGNSEPIVALSAQMMGAESWGNPACNKKVRISLQSDPSKSITARVVDKCPGDECSYGSLDLSPAAFKQLGDMADGVLPIEWNFI
ncbi:hypothetical protein BG000_008662 [Podila horticola]|nr:hypothetical protein BG000_008662 [Podila horticola]